MKYKNWDKILFQTGFYSVADSKDILNNLMNSILEELDFLDFKEFENLVVFIEDLFHNRSLLNVELLIFTDNTTVEEWYYRGT